MMLPNIKAPGLMVSDMNIFHVSPFSLCKTCDQGGRGIFCPRGHNFSKLGKVH